MNPRLVHFQQLRRQRVWSHCSPVRRTLYYGSHFTRGQLLHLQAMVLTTVACGNRYLITGSCLGNFVLRRAPEYPVHRSRMRTLSFSSVPSSSMMTVRSSPFYRPTQLCHSAACGNPAVPSKSFRSSRVLFEVYMSSCVSQPSQVRS